MNHNIQSIAQLGALCLTNTQGYWPTWHFCLASQHNSHAEQNCASATTSVCGPRKVFAVS